MFREKNRIYYHFDLGTYLVHILVVKYIEKFLK